MFVRSRNISFERMFFEHSNGSCVAAIEIELFTIDRSVMHTNRLLVTAIDNLNVNRLYTAMANI